MIIEQFLGCAESAKCHLSCDLSSATEARVGSGHETTNRSVGRAHGCMTWRYFIELFSIKTAFLHERVGTRLERVQTASHA